MMGHEEMSCYPTLDMYMGSKHLVRIFPIDLWFKHDNFVMFNFFMMSLVDTFGEYVGVS